MTLIEFKSKMASKKFFAFIGILVSANVALIFGLVSAALWVDMLKWVAPLYFASDVADKWTTRKERE